MRHNIAAYTMRAAALKPLDIELGLDLDAMVDAHDPRAESMPLTGSVRDAGYNICAVAMRKPAAAIDLAVREGDRVGDTFAGNGAVSVVHAPARRLCSTYTTPSPFRIPTERMA